jgi:hypothetical protein
MLRDAFRGAIASAYRKVIGTAGSNPFNDDFNRADGSINPAEDGGLWQAIRGTFQVSSNKASSLTDSNYPIAAVSSFTNDVTIDIKGTTGSGAALWVTDSGNWWSVGVAQAPEDCNCVEYYNSYTYTYSYSYIASYNQGNCAANNNSCCGYYCLYNSGGNCAGYSCASYNTSNCCGYTCYGYNAYNSKNKTGGNCQGNYCSCYNGSNCASYSCSSYNPIVCGAYTCSDNTSCNNCASYNTGNPNYATGYSNATGYSGPYYNCQTCYPAYIRIFQSVGNVVSTIVNSKITTVVNSLKVTTAGNQITVKAYSDSNQVTQIGSNIVYTATGATIFPRFGLTVVPSTYGQTYQVDEITITPN